MFRSMLTSDVLGDPRLIAVPIIDPELRQRSAQIHTPLPGDLDPAQSELIDLLIGRISQENGGPVQVNGSEADTCAQQPPH